MRALLVNAGNANCATRTGERVAVECVKAAAKAIGAKPEEVLPASTGVIGVEMDGALIVSAMPKLVATLDAARFDEAAAAILTTDTYAKTAFAEVKGARIAGMTKGSGMIHPRMATTLGFVMTDAVIPAGGAALDVEARHRDEAITVFRWMATHRRTIWWPCSPTERRRRRPSLKAFEAALTEVLESLAVQIVRDGEGARKLVTIEVDGAAGDAGAEKWRAPSRIRRW